MSSMSNFQKIKELGKGSFSTVYKVLRKSDNKEYAMKVVKITQLSEKERQNALNEIRILASIVDPNIVAYKEAFFDESIRCLCIIMEYADAGDLLQKINSKKAQKAYFSESQIWRFLIQMTKGLKTLHSLKILHRDLKCANIFQTSDGIAKLGDLNVSKITQKGLAITQAGTPYYCAPEVWKGNVYDKKCDIWSLGCVLYELASLKPPFNGTGMKDLFNRISKGEFERIPRCYSNELYDVIRQCLKLNPNERPTCDEILSNPFIKEKFPEELPREKVFSKAQLLNTIKMPRNLQGLKEKLPKANYQINNKSFEEEEEERNVLRRCPSESGLREKNDLREKNEPPKYSRKNTLEEKDKPYPEERGHLSRNPKYEEKPPMNNNIIKYTPSEAKIERTPNRMKNQLSEQKIEKPPIVLKNPEPNYNYEKPPSMMKKPQNEPRNMEYPPNKVSIERPPSQKIQNTPLNNPMDKYERYEKIDRYEKAGAIIKNNKVEQPLSRKQEKPQAEPPRNYMKPPISNEPPRNVGKVERPLSRPEIKKKLTEDDMYRKPVLVNNVQPNKPLSNNRRPSSQDARKREPEKVERHPQIIKNNVPLKKAEIHQKMIPKPPSTPSNKENIMVGKRYPNLEVKGKKKY